MVNIFHLNTLIQSMMGPYARFGSVCMCVRSCVSVRDDGSIYIADVYVNKTKGCPRIMHPIFFNNSKLTKYFFERMVLYWNLIAYVRL